MAMKNSRSNLDSMDLRLIAELETNPRQSYIKLATTLGITEPTVRRKVNRLLRERVILFASVLNTAAAGYHWSMLGLKVSHGCAQAVADQLALHTLMNVTITSGRYDIMAWATYKDTVMLLDFISGDLGKITDITSVEAFPALKVMKYSEAILGEANCRPLPSTMIRHLDECDWDMLAALEKNPRMTHTDLAKELGISRQTAGARLQRLLDEDAVRIQCILARAALGYGFRLAMLIKVRPNSIDDVAERLIANKSVHYVIVTSGRYDLMAWTIFRDSDEASNFLINEMGAIPGIVSSETVLYLKELSSPVSVRSAMAHLKDQKA